LYTLATPQSTTLHSEIGSGVISGNFEMVRGRLPKEYRCWITTLILPYGGLGAMK
jgi:hypothetical protein